MKTPELSRFTVFCVFLVQIVCSPDNLGVPKTVSVLVFDHPYRSVPLFQVRQNTSKLMVLVQLVCFSYNRAGTEHRRYLYFTMRGCVGTSWTEKWPLQYTFLRNEVFSTDGEFLTFGSLPVWDWKMVTLVHTLVKK